MFEYVKRFLVCRRLGMRRRIQDFCVCPSIAFVQRHKPRCGSLPEHRWVLRVRYIVASPRASSPAMSFSLEVADGDANSRCLRRKNDTRTRVAISPPFVSVWRYASRCRRSWCVTGAMRKEQKKGRKRSRFSSLWLLTIQVPCLACVCLPRWRARAATSPGAARGETFVRLRLGIRDRFLFVDRLNGGSLLCRDARAFLTSEMLSRGKY